LVWDAALDLTAKLMWGRAFRAPVFIEQYGINPVANGNAMLKPETIDTLEAALSWQARKDLQLNLNLFHYTMKEVIHTVPNLVAGTGSTFQNVGSQHGSGLELDAVWDASRSLRLSGNYAYQQSTDEMTGQDAGYAPHHHLYGRADWHIASSWRLSGQLNHVADRHRPPGDVRSKVADYSTFDLTLRSNRGHHGWDFSTSVRNLFNADAREPSLAPGTAIPNDLPMAPRAIYFQASHML
jgi:iron complex outermembrane receptor protein